MLKYKERWLAAERENIRIVLLNRARAKKEQRVYFFGIFIWTTPTLSQQQSKAVKEMHDILLHVCTYSFPPRPRALSIT